MKRLFAYGVMGLAFLACGDSTGVEVNDLAGTWTATSFTYTGTGAGQSADLIALGGSFSVTINQDSTYTMSFREPGGQMEAKVGTVTVVASTLTLAESGEGSPSPFLAVRDGNVLTLTDTDEEYDFDGDQTEEPAVLVIELARG